MRKMQFCLVEDDKLFSDIFKKMLEPFGRVQRFAYAKDAIDYLQTNSPDMLFVDVDLHGIKEGPEIIKQASKRDIQCVAISAYDDEAIIHECINSGATDYYVKGQEDKTFQDIIRKYQDKYFHFNEGIPRLTFEPAYKKSLDLLFTNSKSDFPILLYGPTGTGKTYLAKQLYQYANFKGSFVALNCSSLPEALFESEMFGHKKGSFSGATTDYKGKIKEADGGVLYLDEIDSMPLEQQAKFLKVLEEKQFYPVGSTTLAKSDFKLICSSSKDLKDLVSQKKFREDLFYRITCLNAYIQPLKNRKCDVFPFLKKFIKGPRRFIFNNDAKEAIENYDWPGNIRELEIFAKNLQLMQSSKVTLELIKGHFKRTHAHQASALTKEQIQSYETLGFQKFIQNIKTQLIDHEISKTNNVALACKNIGVSTSSYYKWSEESAIL